MNRNQRRAIQAERIVQDRKTLETVQKLADELAAALRAVLIMRDTVQPHKLDEALTWRKNYEKSDRMAEAVLTKYEAAKK